MNKFKLYYHRNKINNKYYVGITSRKNVETRWGKNGCNYETQLFYRAIQKYGWDNFDHIVLYDNLTKEDAIKLEKEYIIKFNSLIPNGYNSTKGGELTFKNNGILCIETGEIFEKNNIVSFIDNHPELKGRYVEEDILDCCRYKLKSIKVPWKSQYYHFVYNNESIIPSVLEVEKRFEFEVNKRKQQNKKYKYGSRFTYNGVKKIKKICNYCGDTFTYDVFINENKKQRPNYCEKCQRRVKT